MRILVFLLVLLFATPAWAQRIVSLAPALTETLFALGAGAEVVGVSDYCNYPPEAQKKPRVGGPDNPCFERLLALRPDLILVTRFNQDHRQMLARLTKARVEEVETGRISDVSVNIRKLGKWIGREREASRLTKRIEAGLKPSPSCRKRVFYCLWGDPLMTAARGSFLDDLITLAGGKNVVGASPSRFPLFSWEGVIEADPDVILVSSDVPLSALRGRPLRAVREERCYLLPADLMSRPGPRVAEALGAVRAALNGRRLP